MFSISKYITTLMFSLFCSTAFAGELVAGTNDAEALQLLKQTAGGAILMKTSVKDVSSRFHVIKGSDLSWAQALRAADDQFGSNPSKRALFLWKHIPKAASSELLKELRLTNTGFSVGTGSGTSVCLGVERSPESRDDSPGSKISQEKNDFLINIPRWNAVLTFWKAADYSSEGQLTGDGQLVIKDVQFSGMMFEQLNFDIDNALVGFQRHATSTDGKKVMVIGGNMSGEGGIRFYYVHVKKDGKRLESITYFPDFTLKTRTVDYPDRGGTKYREVYKEGQLIRRDHYNPVDDNNRVQLIIRTEKFSIDSHNQTLQPTPLDAVDKVGAQGGAAEL